MSSQVTGMGKRVNSTIKLLHVYQMRYMSYCMNKMMCGMQAREIKYGGYALVRCMNETG